MKSLFFNGDVDVGRPQAHIMGLSLRDCVQHAHVVIRKGLSMWSKPSSFAFLGRRVHIAVSVWLLDIEMASGFGQSTSMPPESSTCSGNNANDAGDFECNICFELAQDPIVTLCGHLFCWPCLYRWLHHHSHSQECPVCKALIQEENLVPLYGRGKTQTDPRAKSYPVYRTTSGFPYGYHAFHGGHAHGFPQPMSRGHHADNVLKNLLLLIVVLVVLALLWW
ncbi:hypothetical protein GH714_012287 [Hevea brasiliensis]|uniref:E3 ubiquitin-protein ligase RMA n=1 Tax=Hevea brasiliensis TaxID=3981 RepID=A0A6A6K4M6_HEVBR|nr:hypothetical protein GH714_012287 [Hevea brasiliensis]